MKVIGLTVVALAFGIDKTSTAYQAVATASATSATTPPSGSCDNEWQASGVYNTGETVSWAGQLWQAQWWTQGDNPSDSGPCQMAAQIVLGLILR